MRTEGAAHGTSLLSRVREAYRARSMEEDVGRSMKTMRAEGFIVSFLYLIRSVRRVRSLGELDELDSTSGRPDCKMPKDFHGFRGHLLLVVYQYTEYVCIRVR